MKVEERCREDGGKMVGRWREVGWKVEARCREGGRKMQGRGMAWVKDDGGKMEERYREGARKLKESRREDLGEVER